MNPISLGSDRKQSEADVFVRDRAQKETTATVEDRTRVFPNSAGRMGDQQDGEAAPTEFGCTCQELTPDRAHRVGMDSAEGRAGDGNGSGELCRGHRLYARRRDLPKSIARRLVQWRNIGRRSGN